MFLIVVWCAHGSANIPKLSLYREMSVNGLSIYVDLSTLLCYKC